MDFRGRTHGALGLVLPALIILLPISAVAQNVQGPVAPDTGAIQGTVSFAQSSGNPSLLEGATVQLNSAKAGVRALSAVTNEQGAYRFAWLPSGSYTLEVSLASFQTITETVELSEGEVLVRDFNLRLAATSQTTVVREEASTIATENTNSTATLASQQIVNLPLAHPNVATALPLVPSVIQTKDGTLNMKGMSENEGMLLVDSAENVEPVTGNFSIPISIDSIQTLSVLETPYGAEYGGFSGGLTEIQTKAPAEHWQFGLTNFIPGFRGKNDHIVGVQDEEPRLYLTGPLWKGKLHFSEAITYSFTRPPVRGLPWPYNETVTQGAGARTSVEAILSRRHVLNLNLNLFSQHVQFAGIGALVPQTASSNDGQHGFSVGAADSYQFASGMLARAVVEYTRVNTNAGGQGPADMLITPEGWGGNYFNSWVRNANQLQVLPSLQLPLKTWLGHHQFTQGADLSRRAYAGTIQSHPVQLLREDGSLAEQINFQGAGFTRGADTEVAEFIEDHWTITDRLTADLGARLVSQVAGRGAALAPRLALAYSPDKGQKTVIRAGAGVFYDRIPMLATDFTDNLTRVVSSYDASGQLAGAPVSFENVYLQKTSDGGFAVATDDLDSTARNVTWSIELERELGRNLQFHVSYLQSATGDLPIVMPMPDAAGSPVGTSLLGLAYSGNSRYHALETALHIQINERDELDVSYIHSDALSDLNLVSSIFVPFEQPVIRPNSYGISPSDVPNRFEVTGLIAVPHKWTISPVLDVRSGLPFSAVDVLQNYVGAPNSLRFPYYFSLDFQIYRDFPLTKWKFIGPLKNHSARVAGYSLDVTNRHNPNDVFNNVTSPEFGTFAGLGRRFDGFVIELH
jgi:hypothetical protein